MFAKLIYKSTKEWLFETRAARASKQPLFCRPWAGDGRRQRVCYVDTHSPSTQGPECVTVSCDGAQETAFLLGPLMILMHGFWEPLPLEIIYLKYASCYCAQSLCRIRLCDPMDCMWPTRLLCPWDFPGRVSGVGCLFLLQGIFPDQGSNPCLVYWPPGKPLIKQYMLYIFSVLIAGYYYFSGHFGIICIHHFLL